MSQYQHSTFNATCICCQINFYWLCTDYVICQKFTRLLSLMYMYMHVCSHHHWVARISSQQQFLRNYRSMCPPFLTLSRRWRPSSSGTSPKLANFQLSGVSVCSTLWLVYMHVSHLCGSIYSTCTLCILSNTTSFHPEHAICSWGNFAYI